MEVRDVELPGVGRKFALRTNDDERITVIIHNTGARELYHFRKDEDFPFHAVRLDDQEARQLSAILGGAYFQPVAGGASMDMLMEQLAIEWVKVTKDSPLAGHGLAELDLRKRTGASVLAILRNKQLIANPSPEEAIRPEDTVVVAGTHEQVSRFLAFTRGSAM